MLLLLEQINRYYFDQCVLSYLTSLGDYCIEVPPLPIPNRVVKLNSADGTAYSGRVGRRRLFIKASKPYGFGAFYIFKGFIAPLLVFWRNIWQSSKPDYSFVNDEKIPNRYISNRIFFL
jgi:hypothetical protein